MKRLLSLLLLIAILGCKKQKEDASPLVAQVAKEALHENAFRSTFSDEQYQALSAQERKKYVEDWVNLTLMAQEADAIGLSDTPAVRQKIDYATKKMKANALISQRMSQIQVSENELFNYYRIHQAEFAGKILEYNVQRIYLTSSDLVAGLISRLNAGLDFDEAVRANSRENLRLESGRMGFVNPLGADSLFWTKARELKESEAGSFEADGGWYIIRWTESRQSDQDAGFEEFKPEIRERILAERQSQVYQDLLRELKKKNPEIYYY